MRGRTKLSIIGLAAGATLALALLLVTGGTAGQYHSGSTLYCYDCHTIHASQSHGWAGGTVGTTGALGGDWLKTQGNPAPYLLKAADPNTLCLACHDAQTFAPDVLGANTNAAAYPSGAREAGGLPTGALPYENWKGHLLGSTSTPPGFNPTNVGLSATWYDNTKGLECISCHAQHGPAASYRNLGAYALGATSANFRPTYAIQTTTPTAGSADVWINLSSVTTGSGSAATFGPYYDQSNISFLRYDALGKVGNVSTSNRMGSFCASCHSDFHGSPGDTNIGATAAALDGFLRHPTSGVTLGAAAAQSFGGHSALSRYTGATNKVKVLASNFSTYSDASPFCFSCHKGHGNQNPFGLIFMGRTGSAPAAPASFEEGTTTDPAQGQRNLCGQCHGQGN